MVVGDDNLAELLAMGIGGWLCSYMADALGNRTIGSVMRLTVVASCLGGVLTVGVAVYKAGKRIYDKVDAFVEPDNGALNGLYRLYKFIDGFPF